MGGSLTGGRLAYPYRGAGLTGIHLLNGFTLEQHDGEEHVAISDLEGLHAAIGRHIALRPTQLDPGDIRFLRSTLDLTQAELGARLGTSSQSVARWEKGQTPIPATSDRLLRAVYLATTLPSHRLPELAALLGTEVSSTPAGPSARATMFLTYSGGWQIADG